MQSRRIITNNGRIAEYVKQEEKPFLLDAIGGDVRDVVFHVRDLLMEGWSLAADPLAGRKERANPFLTVILEKEVEAPSPDEAGPETGSKSGQGGLVGSAGISGKGGEILRVEQLLDIFERNEQRLSQLNERQRSDYAAIDASLARGALEKL